MNYAIHRISLDVTDDSPSQLTIAAKQGDTAKILIISLLDDKKNYQIAQGSVAVFIAKKSNGVWLEHPCTIDYKSNKVLYTFKEDTVRTSGTMECEIHLSFATTVTKEDGSSELVNEDLTTASFVIAVHDTILSGLTDETEEATLLPDLITKGTSLFTTLEQVTIPNAEEATGEANTATNNANSAANNAREQADYAEEQGNYAKAQSVYAEEQGNYAKAQGEYIESFQERVDNGEFNGVSVTHSWNGTTLTVTSASGTSSANLRGDKGEKGDKGDTGDTVATTVELGKNSNGQYYSSFNGEESLKRKYKIFCNEGAKIIYNTSVNGNTNSIEIPLTNGEHRDYCVFELLKAEFTYSTFSGSTSYTYKVYYELNGVVYSATCSGTVTVEDPPHSILSMRVLYVSKASLFQDNITIQGLRGERGEKGDRGEKGEDGGVGKLRIVRLI